MKGVFDFSGFLGTQQPCRKGCTTEVEESCQDSWLQDSAVTTAQNKKKIIPDSPRKAIPHENEIN